MYGLIQLIDAKFKSRTYFMLVVQSPVLMLCSMGERYRGESFRLCWACACLEYYPATNFTGSVGASQHSLSKSICTERGEHFLNIQGEKFKGFVDRESLCEYVVQIICLTN